MLRDCFTSTEATGFPSARSISSRMRVLGSCGPHLGLTRSAKATVARPSLSYLGVIRTKEGMQSRQVVGQFDVKG
jgi:hypothetical protein